MDENDFKNLLKKEKDKINYKPTKKRIQSRKPKIPIESKNPIQSRKPKIPKQSRKYRKSKTPNSKDIIWNISKNENDDIVELFYQDKDFNTYHDLYVYEPKSKPESKSKILYNTKTKKNLSKNYLSKNY